jgi:hypothetical protein
MVISFLLEGVSLHVLQQVAPCLALWGQGLMPNLNSCDGGMAFSAEHQQIAERVGEFGVRPNGLNVVTFEASPRSAVLALPVVAFQGLHP